MTKNVTWKICWGIKAFKYYCDVLTSRQTVPFFRKHNNQDLKISYIKMH